MRKRKSRNRPKKGNDDKFGKRAISRKAGLNGSARSYRLTEPDSIAQEDFDFYYEPGLRMINEEVWQTRNPVSAHRAGIPDRMTVLETTMLRLIDAHGESGAVPRLEASLKRVEDALSRAKGALYAFGAIASLLGILAAFLALHK